MLPQNLTTCDEINSEIIKIKNLNESTMNLSTTLKNTSATLNSAIDRLSANNGPFAGIFLATSEVVETAANVTSNQATQFKESLNYNENLIKKLMKKATELNCNGF